MPRQCVLFDFDGVIADTERRNADYLAAALAQHGVTLSAADRLARVFSQYLVYRSDWLQAWEAGKHAYATAKHGEGLLDAFDIGAI